jgi:hypothetical protein
MKMLAQRNFSNVRVNRVEVYPVLHGNHQGPELNKYYYKYTQKLAWRLSSKLEAKSNYNRRAQAGAPNALPHHYIEDD